MALLPSILFSVLCLREQSAECHVGVLMIPCVNNVVEYKEAFNLFDKDRNGTICTHELRNVMHALGQSPSDQEIADMIACSDKDGKMFVLNFCLCY